ncbi:MAG: helix-turn-helix domain-containing protein [Nitrospirae bacterium]|nr:helix-turn-helix domain-containing protein [Nitrospirota bacterium]
MDNIDNIGEYLKKIRGEKGISLEDLSSKTRINIKCLKALEENDFARIPVKVFARGFLRAYARALALDEKEILTLFDNSSREYYENKSANEWLKEKKEIQVEKDTKKNSFILSLVAGGFLLILIMFIIFHSIGSRRGDQSVDSSLEEVIIPPSPPVKESGSLVQEERISDDIQAEGPQVKVPPREMLLEVEATEDTWVSAKIDDGIIKEALLKPGDKVVWKASNKFLLTLGNAGGVNLKWNGKPLEPLGPRGRVIRNYPLQRE